MQVFNLVYKVKKAKTEKSGVVDRLQMAYIEIIKGFLNLYLASSMWIHCTPITLNGNWLYHPIQLVWQCSYHTRPTWGCVWCACHDGPTCITAGRPSCDTRKWTVSGCYQRTTAHFIFNKCSAMFWNCILLYFLFDQV